MTQLKQKSSEVSMGEIFSFLKNKFFLIILVVTLFGIAGVILALSKNNIYQAEVVLVPSNSGSDSAGGIGGQFGGLAALAGVNLGANANDKSVLHIERLKSRKFLTQFIAKHNLHKDIYAVEGADKDTGKMNYDKDKLKRLDKNAQNAISVNYIYDRFIEDNLDVEVDKKTGLISLVIYHYSADFAKKLADLLVKDINQEIRKEEINDADNSIAYLELALKNTNVLETKKVFYQLIEQQLRTKMLATVKDEYAFKTIDPAIVPEHKYSPNRALIVSVSMFIGIIFISSFVIIRGLQNRLK